MTTNQNVNFCGSRYFFKDYSIVFRGTKDFCENPQLNDFYRLHKENPDSCLQLHIFYNEPEVSLADIKYSLCYLFGIHQYEPSRIEFKKINVPEKIADEIAQCCTLYLPQNLTDPEREMVSRLQRHGVKIIWGRSDLEEMMNFDPPFDPGLEQYFKKRPHDKGRLWYSIIEVPPHFVDRVRVGYGSKLYEPYISYSGNATINIGVASYISVNPHFFIDADFHLGNFCQISTNFTAVTRRHAITNLSLGGVAGGAFGYFGEKVDKQEEIWIGNDVWIGTKVTVLPGVNIGHGCVIGASSVITENCKPYGIYAGNPAQFVRYRFPEDKIKLLLESQWWNWPLKKIWAKRDIFRQKIDEVPTVKLRKILGDS